MPVSVFLFVAAISAVMIKLYEKQKRNEPVISSLIVTLTQQEQATIRCTLLYKKTPFKPLQMFTRTSE